MISNGGNATIFGQNAILNGIFKRCHIENTNAYAIWVAGTTSENVFFEDCDIVSETNCVRFQGTLERDAETRTTFKRCSFYTRTGSTTGEIFVEDGYSSSDLGKTQLIGTTVYNKAFTTSTPARFEVLGDQLTITDSQIPSF